MSNWVNSNLDLFRLHNLDDFEELYLSISDKVPFEIEDLIEKDVSRTFPYEVSVDSEVLKVLLYKAHNYDPEIGYTQGMNFLMGTILFHAGTNLSMALAVYLLMMKKTNLREVFQFDLKGFYYHLG